MAGTTALRSTAPVADAAGRPAAKLRLACADFSFPLLDHSTALEQISRLGFQGVDVGLFPHRSHFQPCDYLDNPAQAARTLTRRVRDQGLDVADLFLQSGPDLEEQAENHPDERQRERSRTTFLRTLEFAVLADVKHMTSLPGIVWKHEAPGDSFRRSADELAWRAECAQALGVVYAIEPHMWSVAPTPEAALDLVEASPGLTLTVDYSHFACQGISDERSHALVAHASHFHARSACRGLLQAPLEKNSVDFAGMLRHIRRAGYCGWIGVEYVCMETTPEVAPVDNLAETGLLRDLLETEWKSAG